VQKRETTLDSIGTKKGNCPRKPIKMGVCHGKKKGKVFQGKRKEFQLRRERGLNPASPSDSQKKGESVKPRHSLVLGGEKEWEKIDVAETCPDSGGKKPLRMGRKEAGEELP